MTTMDDELTLALSRQLAEQRANQNPAEVLAVAAEVWQRQALDIFDQADTIQAGLAENPANSVTQLQELHKRYGNWGVLLALMHLGGDTSENTMSKYAQPELRIPTERKQILRLIDGQTAHEVQAGGFLTTDYAGHRSATVIATPQQTLRFVSPEAVNRPSGVMWQTTNRRQPEVLPADFAQWGQGWGQGTNAEVMPQELRHALRFKVENLAFGSGHPYLSVWELVHAKVPMIAQPDTFFIGVNFWNFYNEKDQDLSIIGREKLKRLLELAVQAGTRKAVQPVLS